MQGAPTQGEGVYGVGTRPRPEEGATQQSEAYRCKSASATRGFLLGAYGNFGKRLDFELQFAEGDFLEGRIHVGHPQLGFDERTVPLSKLSDAARNHIHQEIRVGNILQGACQEIGFHVKWSVIL